MTENMLVGETNSGKEGLEDIYIYIYIYIYI